MTLEELEILVVSLQTQLNKIEEALKLYPTKEDLEKYPNNDDLKEYATQDNLSAITKEIKTLQDNNNTIQNTVSTLDTYVKKINHLNKLLDVSLYNVTENDLLQYSSDGKWHNVNPNKLGITSEESASTVSSLNDLSDVLLGDVENGDVLVYNSIENKWTNGKTSSSDPTDLSNYLTKDAANSTYFKIQGGEIQGNVTIKKSLLVYENIDANGNIYADGSITAKMSNESES